MAEARVALDERLYAYLLNSEPPEHEELGLLRERTRRHWYRIRRSAGDDHIALRVHRDGIRQRFERRHVNTNEEARRAQRRRYVETSGIVRGESLLTPVGRDFRNETIRRPSGAGGSLRLERVT